MEKVSGIGGFFFRSKDPEALVVWYETHFGITQVPDDYGRPSWRQEAGVTVFAPFPENTSYFGELKNMWMIDFRVRDLEAMISQLRAAGIEVTADPKNPYPNGSFAHLIDPEGNRIELWEPAGRDGEM